MVDKKVEEVKEVEPVKQKNKRSDKQLEAFNKMRERMSEKKTQKKVGSIHLL